MNNQFFRLPEGASPQARNAYRVFLVFIPAQLIVVGFLAFLTIQTPSWRLWAMDGLGVGMLILETVSLFQVRRGRHEMSIWLTFIPFEIMLFVIILMYSGLGLVLTISAIALPILIASQTLPPRQARLFSGIGVVAGVAIILAELYIPFQRTALPGFQNVIYFALAIIIPVLGHTFFRQFHNYSLNAKLISVVAFILILIAAVQFQVSSVRSRQQVEAEAQARLTGYYQTYVGRVTAESNAAAAMAASIAGRPDVQDLYLKGDRDGLYALLQPMFEKLKERQIVHLYIEKPDGTVFLRVHDPKKFADDVTYRGTAADALAFKETTSGIEIGPNRMGVRGVAPMYSGNQFIGMIEVGLDFDQKFIADLKELSGADFTMWVSYKAAAAPKLKPAEGAPDAPIEELFYYASTNPQTLPVDPELYRSVFITGKSGFQVVAENTSTPSIVYITPLLGYKDKSLGLMEISFPYTETLDALQASRITSLSVVGGLTLIGLILILIANSQFVVKPINSLTQFANLQMSGDTSIRVHVSSGDEFEQLANTFNSLADSVKDERGRLESRVAERTHSLELAADVGRSVSQVRALDVMLKDAAELIRSRFDLYYVQVYLSNPSQTALVLQSGTGTVGAELIGRGHQLPLNTGSINGRAATEKRSVVISDTAASATFRPNPLLPDTRSEMAVPLLIGEKVVGVLDLQSQQANLLNKDILPAFEALAGQLAIAIQNANFLAETEQARAVIEAQARRQARANWVDYLDAIHKPEEIGFVFEQNKIAPISGQAQSSTNENALTAPIAITGEALGNLVVELDGQSPISQASELVSSVARQVAQQIESLRLLDSAERYRFEAEQASRRLTREGWKDYVGANADGDLSFIYDLKEVRPHKHDGDQGTDEAALTLPLKVRDEAVGRLVVQGLGSDDKESFDLAAAVAERLGAHIESLRQYDQTQSALAQSEKLFDASSRLAQAADLQGLVGTAVETINIPEINRAILAAFNYGPTNDLSGLDVIANWWNGSGHEVTPVGTHYPLEVIRLMPMFISPTPVFFNDTSTDERVDATTMELVKRMNLRALAVLPLHSGTHQIGALILESEGPHKFTQSEARLYTALAPQIATVLENRRQFEQAQKQAERETTLNLISQKIQSATTVEAVLQIAARELGHALGAPMTIAQLSMKDKK